LRASLREFSIGFLEISALIDLAVSPDALRYV
jgi:hypothetical protein